MCNVARLDAFTEQWPGSEYGPGHIVLDDANLEDGSIDYCIALTKAVLDPAQPWPGDEAPRAQYREDVLTYHRREELEATLAFLIELRAVPYLDRVAPGDRLCVGLPLDDEDEERKALRARAGGWYPEPSS